MAGFKRVIATADGFYGGTIRKLGESFPLEADVWNDKKRRPSWVRLANGEDESPATIVGKGPAPGGPEGAMPGGVALVVPADWQSRPAKKRRELAEAISGGGVSNAKEADAIIQDHVENASGPAFGEAPSPVVADTGIQAALGSPAPDWVATGSGQPAQVD